MSNYQYFVGIDVSKQTLDVALVHLVTDGQHRCEVANDAEGFGELLRWLNSCEAAPDRTVACLENTGLYDDRLLEALTLAGYSCAVEKTTVLKKVRPEHHRKEDSFDAGLLAEYAYRFEDKLSLWKAPAPVIEEIRLLYRERRRLKTQRAAVLQLQSEAAYRTASTRFAEALWHEQVTFFDEQVERIEKKLDKLIRSDEQLYRRYRQVKSMPGIGRVTSLLWMTLFYGEEHLNARRIASRFGFAPHVHTSGTSQHTRSYSSGHGKSEVRKVLTLCARSVGRHDEKFSAYKAKKLDEGKPSQLVTNNIINRLIHIVCALWNQDTFYDPDHVSRFTRNAKKMPWALDKVIAFAMLPD